VCVRSLNVRALITGLKICGDWCQQQKKVSRSGAVALKTRSASKGIFELDLLSPQSEEPTSTLKFSVDDVKQVLPQGYVRTAGMAHLQCRM